MATIKTNTSLLLSLFLAIATTLWLSSCEQKAKTTDTEEIAEEQNEPKVDATKEKDENFLMKAAEINLEDVQLGQLAQQKGTHADVKSLGQMLATEHGKAMSDLQALASSKSIAVPTSPTKDVQDKFQKLGEKSGMDFDKEYCEMMVNGHQNAIDLYENAANNAADPDIRSWANNMLPGLRNHLEQAKACREKLKEM